MSKLQIHNGYVTNIDRIQIKEGTGVYSRGNYELNLDDLHFTLSREQLLTLGKELEKYL